MCGICGVIVAPNGQLPHPKVLSDARGYLIDRGPDDRGEYHGEGAWLGHTRLSTIDLAGGHQPMRGSDDRVVVVFNGEIWNHRELRQQLASRGYSFTTRCDTEVLLHGYREWGATLPEHIDGQFAFGIWDDHAKRLLLARDRLGEKPLFVAENRGALAFASDCRSALKLAGLRPAVNRERLPEFLLQRYVAAPNTLFSDVHKLPPGHLLIHSQLRGRVTSRPYWSINPPAQNRVTDGQSFSSADLRGVLERAVERRLMGDVPIGVFLSGGVDSAAVLAMASAREPSLTTFTIGFRDPRYDERSRAGAAARHFGTRHHEIEVGPEDFMAALPRLATHRDEPIAEPSEVPLLLLAEGAAGKVKVVLTGDAGDEVFGGYPKYRAERFLRHIGSLGGSALAVGATIARMRGSHRQLGRAVETARMDDRMMRWISWFRSFGIDEVGDLVADSDRSTVSLQLVDEARSVIAAYSDVDPDRQLMILDLLRWLPDNMLARGDKVLMAASLEGRSPLVDQELVTAVSAAWSSSSMGIGRSKSALREAVADLLPPGSLSGPKRGFTVPVAHFLNHGPDRPLEKLVLSDRALDRGLLDADSVRRGVSADRDAGGSLKLFTLASLELWQRHHVDADGAGSPEALTENPI